jgi:hypothetical protein
VFGIGPDMTLPVGSKSTLFALLSIRYLWETRAQSKTMGNILALRAMFSVPQHEAEIEVLRADALS